MSNNAALDDALLRGIIAAHQGVAASLLDTSYGGEEVTDDEKHGIAESIEPLFATDELHPQFDAARRIQVGRILTNQALQRINVPGIPDPLASPGPFQGQAPLGRWAEGVAMGLRNGPEALSDPENLRAIDRITRSAPNYAENVGRTASGRQRADEARAGLSILVSHLRRYPDEPTAVEWLQRAQDAYTVLDDALR